MSTSTATPVTAQTLTDRIQDAVLASKGISIDELVATLGHSRGSISGRLATLKKRGIIKMKGWKSNSQGKPSAVYVKGKAAPKTKPQATTTPARPAAPAIRLKNHFVLVCDGSGSMNAHKRGAAELFNSQLDTVAAAADQENSVTVFHFGLTPQGPESIKEIRFNAAPSMVERFTEYNYPATGNTPLYAAVVKAGRRAMCDQDAEKSFVMLVLTDGEENQSHEFGIAAEQLREFISERQATDRWTFVFLVPKGYKRQFIAASGVHDGNVREWSDINKAREELTTGTQAYLYERKTSNGLVRSSKSWFTTDLSKITIGDLTTLKDITDDVRSWTVDQEEEIAKYVGLKTGGSLAPTLDPQGKPMKYEKGAKAGQEIFHVENGRFAPGRSFFEIMKKEKQFQDYKRLLLMDRTTKRIYADGSQTVRKLCGFPERGDVAIEPGNHGNYVLLGQSTSTNRLVPRGTRLIFWEGAV